MPTGVYIKGSSRTGGVFSAGTDGIPLIRVTPDLSEGKLPSGSVVGIDSDDLRIETFFTTETAEKPLSCLIRLQEEFHRAALKESTERLSYTLNRTDAGTGVIFITAPQLAGTTNAAVYPAFVALYALAWEKGLIKPGQNVLLMFFAAGQVLTLTVADEKIVFARSFPADGLAANFRLSAQAVYGVRQRYLLKPDRVVMIGPLNETGAWSDVVRAQAVVVDYLDTTAFFADAGLEDAERADLLMAYGLSLAPRIPALAGWELNRSSGHRHCPKKILLRCAVMALVALPLFLLAEGLSDRVLINRIDHKLASLAPAYKRTARVMENVALMKKFAGSDGRNLISPDICLALFKDFDLARTEDIVLTSIAGNPYGKIALAGTAENYNALLHCINNLGKAPGIAGYELLYANSDERGRIDFQLLLRYKFAKEFINLNSTDDDAGVTE